jgi:hypothetical protein
MSGVIPALPLIVIRPFLPESPVWREKHAAGTLKRPSLRELFSPALNRVTIVSTIMLALVYGAAFGALQQVPQMVPGVPQVQEQARGLTPPQVAQLNQKISWQMTLISETGGLLGRTLLAFLAVRIISRQRLLRIFQIPAFIALPIVFGLVARSSLTGLFVGNLILGMLVIGQFSFWGTICLAFTRCTCVGRREFCDEHRGTSPRNLLCRDHRNTGRHEQYCGCARKSRTRRLRRRVRRFSSPDSFFRTGCPSPEKN